MHTLCIIDMQDSFSATANAIRGVIHEIKLARERNDHIIVVEYKDNGPTNSKIKQALRGYALVTYCRKDMNNGAGNIVRVAKRYKIPLDKVRVVGVNLSYCVYETVRGFEMDYKDVVKQIFVPVRATACTVDMETAIENIKGFAHWHKTVKVIE